jgi:hypothetical protein
VISVLRLSRAVAVGVAAVVVGGGLAASSSAAPPPSAALSHVVLARSLPGFTLLPHGQFDGPIPEATLDAYSEQSQWKQDVADGQLTGFVRAWGRIYQRGPAILYLSALVMPDAAFAPVFTSSVGTLASEQPAATTIAVNGVTGATAYRTSPPIQLGRATGYWIIFTRGDVGFFLYEVGPPRSVTAAQVASVARQQASHASGG